MRFLVDECCEKALVVELRRLGHDVLYMLEHGRGTSDRDIADLARKDRRVLITDDKDFGELVVRQKLASSGLILLRIDPVASDRRAKALSKAIERFGDRLERQITVVRSNVVRVRLLES
jgi:predicted nuclease of predicted toxin-antitoxin system